MENVTHWQITLTEIRTILSFFNRGHELPYIDIDQKKKQRNKECKAMPSMMLSTKKDSF